jgi:septal ring factor EnvC (AmiA/AmiB activator)
MRIASPALLAALTLIALPVRAEVTTVPITSIVNAEVASLNAQLDQLEQRLAESERMRSELNSQLESSAAVQGNAQVSRLNQDNQRLKMQLKAAQAQQPGQLFNEQQKWFGIGGGVALLAFLFGALARGANKKRRDWMS